MIKHLLSGAILILRRLIVDSPLDIAHQGKFDCGRKGTEVAIAIGQEPVVCRHPHVLFTCEEAAGKRACCDDPLSATLLFAAP